ncbi:para-hydroxybenzoate-polyprenyltransferaseCoq2, partial [Schizosaccharomyces japonicus yFS275]
YSSSETSDQRCNGVRSKTKEKRTALFEKIKTYGSLSRVHAPVGTILLYCPCTWSILMAAYSIKVPIFSTVKVLTIFALGSFVMRSAGCVINDLWDRKLDAKVRRSSNRPLANGKVGVPEALGLLGVQLSTALIILCSLNSYTVKLGVLSLLPVSLYPSFKRFTYYPQAFLGLTFSYGALMGWPALVGADAMFWPVVAPLYLSSVFWVIMYDTIYAHQDKLDDVHAGIYSTALKFGKRTKPVLFLLASIQYVFLSFAGMANHQGPIFYLLGVCGSYISTLLMIFNVNLNSPKNCMHWFKQNSKMGYAITLAITLDWIISFLK